MLLTILNLLGLALLVVGLHKWFIAKTGTQLLWFTGSNIFFGIHALMVEKPLFAFAMFAFAFVSFIVHIKFAKICGGGNDKDGEG